MDDLIGEFIAETREMLERLGGHIVAWEQAPDDRARLDEIFRFVHTVKGNSGFFDLPEIQILSHAAEEALAEVRSGRRSTSRELVSAVLAAIDRIGERMEALDSGRAPDGGDDGQLIARLKDTEAAPADAPHATAAGPELRTPVRSVRLPLDLIEEIMSGVSDLVLARNELARELRDSGASAAVESAFARVSGCVAEMRDSIMRTRMQRIDTLFMGLPRMVRDLAGQLGKEVALEISGGEVELDREMIEVIRDPLTHIVRNALDHGIEPAAERAAAGKRETACLRICAGQSGNQILVEVSDDGRGIDGDRLAAKAVEAGLVSPEEAPRLTPQQKSQLVFEAGLSTADEVTAISGRGVGMDVVRANIERLGGSVELRSKAGQGLTLSLRVPLTLTIIPALTVTAGGCRYAVPRSTIEEIVSGRSESLRLESPGGVGIATVRGRSMPLLSLAELLGVAAEEAGFVLVLRAPGSGAFALAVASVCDHEELVVKPAAPAVMTAGLYGGTAIGDDGMPILLLDPAAIAATAQLAFAEEAAQRCDEAAAETHGDHALLLFTALDGKPRAVPLAAVQRVEQLCAEQVQESGGAMRAAIDGRLFPLLGGARPGEAVRALRIVRGTAEAAYAVREMADIVRISASDIQAPAVPGEVSGVVLIGGRQVELLDPDWIARAAAALVEAL
jgi:two-component system chemotaxis sensor kinase CheA